MLVLFGIFLGSVFGYIKAKKQNGELKDYIHQIFVFAIAFGLLSWIITLAIGWIIAYP